VSSWRVGGLLSSSTSYGLYYLLDRVVGKSYAQVNPPCLALYAQVEPLLAQALYGTRYDPTTQTVRQSVPAVNAGRRVLAYRLEEVMRLDPGCLVEWKKK
jgi:hypothetical protein